MINAEAIQGEAIVSVLNEMVQNRTLVRMRIAEWDFEQLTIIHALRLRKCVSCFLVENPVAFRESMIDYCGLPFAFEFTNSNGILYSFRALGEGIENEAIWLRLPEVIERKQQRKDFRIDVPPNTFLYFTYREEKRTLSVMNLSLGGSLGVLLQGSILPEPDQFAVGDEIQNLRLVFRDGPLTRQFFIQRARVVRTELKHNDLSFRLACEFLKMEKDEERKLTEIIFELQRQILRKRIRDIRSFEDNAGVSSP